MGSAAHAWSNCLLKLAERCNSFLLPGSSRSTCLPFIVCKKQVGLVRPDALAQLKCYPDVFAVGEGPKSPGLYLSESLHTAEDRNLKVAEVLQDLRRKDTLVTLKGWRGETYDVRYKFNEEPLMKIERAATCLFGLSQCGTHINGYTFDEDNKLLMWIGRRSKTKQTYPGMLDNMCAGGLASGLGFLECAKKECEEEASVDEETLKNLKSTGCISYYFEDERGLFPELEYTFDLELPRQFVPKNGDGEVQSFQLMSLDRVKEHMIAGKFKPNSALVIVHFMIRHGYVTPDNEPNFVYLSEMMHVPLQALYTDSAFPLSRH